VADINTTLKQQIFDLPQRERITDVHHHREADHLGRTVEITEGILHRCKLRNSPARLKPICSDTARPRPGRWRLCHGSGVITVRAALGLRPYRVRAAGSGLVSCHPCWGPGRLSYKFAPEGASTDWRAREPGSVFCATGGTGLFLLSLAIGTTSGARTHRLPLFPQLRTYASGARNSRL